MTDLNTDVLHDQVPSVSRLLSAPALATSRRVIIDGHARTAPLGGVHYLQFLENLHRKRRISRYLEIGTQRGMSLSCAVHRAIAIDPHFLLDKQAWAQASGFHFFEMTSDEFFASYNPSAVVGGAIELAFIDGMHLSEYVLRDFINVERHCTRDSLIVLHDALPQNFEMTERERRPWARHDRALAAAWTGDVWRVIPILSRERPDLRIQVLDCPPTGLVLISNLDPHSRALDTCLEDETGSLASQLPSEAEFWSFIESVPITDSRIYT